MANHINDRIEFCFRSMLEKPTPSWLLFDPLFEAVFGSVDRTKKIIITDVRIQIFSTRLIT